MSAGTEQASWRDQKWYCGDVRVVTCVRTCQRLAVVRHASHTSCLARRWLGAARPLREDKPRKPCITNSPEHQVPHGRSPASEMRTIRSLTRKSEGIHAGKRCMTMTVAGWSNALKSAALQAARWSTRGRGWTFSAWASSWECRAAQSRSRSPRAGAQLPTGAL